MANALDDAAQRWPEDREARARLLLRLVRAGHAAIRASLETESGERRAALQRTAGALTGVYDEGYLQQLRDDWPT